MKRRVKLERILDYYAIPSHGRTVGRIAAGKPLKWFTDEQLEDIAATMVADARRVARIQRDNRERMMAPASPMEEKE